MVEENEKPIRMTAFMIDERPHAFVHDEGANRRFLESIDRDYWLYQSEAHEPHLEADKPEQRRRAAVALRIAYSQGLETLFALIAAWLQCPTYPVGWLAKYTNHDLRSVVRKINARTQLPCFVHPEISWQAVSAAIHEYCDESKRDEAIEDYATLWERLARDFAEEHFEPEYNNLKHGMRASVGGFSVSISAPHPPGQAAPKESMNPIGRAEYGSTFWMPPRRLDDCKFTYELSKNRSSGWSPTRFTNALPLIGLSINNVASRALISAGVDPTTVKFSSLSDRTLFNLPFKEFPTIIGISFGNNTRLRNWREPSTAEILRRYPSHQED